jgi:HSP20 family protein
MQAFRFASEGEKADVEKQQTAAGGAARRPFSRPALFGRPERAAAPAGTTPNRSQPTPAWTMDSLTRYRPSRSLRNLQEEVNRVFDSLFSPAMDEDGESGAVWTPRLDLTETEDGFQLAVDLPGMKKDDVHIRMEDDRLIISGERTEEKKEEDRNMVRMERSFGSFYRSLRLPKGIKDDQIRAHFRNGVLKVDLPKTEVSKPKRIEIE